jgi:hypothetical protein
MQECGEIKKMKKIIMSIMVLVLVLVAGCNSTPIQQCATCDNNKALLTSTLDSYYINELNEEEMFFAFWITNFGYEEAKDIEVRCLLEDENGDIVKDITKNIGNIASTQISYDEITTDVSGLSGEGYYAPACFIVSCNNCELLDRRIPDFVEIINEYEK